MPVEADASGICWDRGRHDDRGDGRDWLARLVSSVLIGPHVARRTGRVIHHVVFLLASVLVGVVILVIGADSVQSGDRSGNRTDLPIGVSDDPRWRGPDVPVVVATGGSIPVKA